jgi:hypothetical protein
MSREKMYTFEFVCKLGFFWHSWAFKTLVTHERVEYNGFFIRRAPFEGFKSLKSLTFRFDKL